MVRSMTGFASADISLSCAPDWGAAMEIKSVNAKGLDVRTRVPDWIPGLEADVKKQLTSTVTRGSVSISIRLARQEITTSQMDLTTLRELLDQLQQVEGLAAELGMTLSPVTAIDLLSARNPSSDATLPLNKYEPVKAELLTRLADLIPEFEGSRSGEGAQLAAMLTGQIAQIERLLADAAQVLPDRQDRTRAKIRDALQKLMAETDIDEARLAQELATIAIKGDVTEELDRLSAHCAAARTLLNQDGPIGRKLDFLCQEFNREANTLCSKSGDADLTRIGLTLKTVIEQMREQVQNVE